jgi:hypothetical protein
MMFKETSVHIKRIFVYDSPDGEVYTITYSESPDRKYVEIKRKDDLSDKYKSTHDFDMLAGIVDGIRDAIRPKAKMQHNLQKPRITDMRDSDGIADKIQSEVNKSMENYDDTKTPSESLSADGASVAEDEEEHVPGWKKDVMSRKNIVKPEVIPVGSTGEGFRRIDASELI